MNMPDEAINIGKVQNFFAGIFIKVITDPDVQAAAKRILGQLIIQQFLPLVPVAAGAVAKAVVDELIVKMPGVEGVVDVVKATDSAINALNEAIPEVDLGIPVLNDLMNWWRPKH